MMEKKVIVKKIKQYILGVISNIMFFLVLFGYFATLCLISYVSFFPILFIFNFYFWIGHNLFLKYVLRRKWSDCTKDNFLSIKYIFTPLLIMEMLAMLCYYNETKNVISSMVEGNEVELLIPFIISFFFVKPKISKSIDE